MTDQQQSLSGQVAVVTGASRGIGRAIAVDFARAGADIVVAARSSEKAPTKLPGTIEETAREVEAAGRKEALEASERTIRAIERAEQRLSTWRASSELSRLNSTPAGDVLQLSAELTAELGEARRIWKETGGAFDPGIGALVRTFDLRGEGREPEPLAKWISPRGIARIAEK